MNNEQEQGERCVGVEVTHAGLTSVCIDAGGNIIAVERADVDPRISSSQQIIAFINGLKGKFPHFSTVGIAIPGLIAAGGRTVTYSARIPEHSGLDLGTIVSAATGKSVIVENDANAAGFGEFHLGAGRGAQDMFFATLGIGVGGTIIFGGRIWRGVTGFAGEFGYIPINSEGVRLEEVASSANIIRRTRSRFQQDSTSSLVEIDEAQLSISDIVSAAEAEDDFARLMLERTGHYVGTGVASVINLLNIERIVIGGEIIGGQHIILESIIDRARELSFAPSFASTVIAASELGANAAAAGAALLAREAEAK
ncbi:MAG: ROK family protein [Acidobacteriota bacterium]